jgi:hypothetical protein
MSPLGNKMRVVGAPYRVVNKVGRSALLRPRSILVVLIALLLAVPSISDAQRRKRRRGKAKKTEAVASVKESKNKSGGKNQVFDFTGLNLGASMRTPQLLYFLDRASEELHRASLRRRSFVPEMVRSISEEGL